MDTSSFLVEKPMSFAQRLAYLRKQRNLTQEQLSQMVQVTKTQIYRYESGTSQPTLDVIKRLAIALVVTTDDLIFDDDERKPDPSLELLLESIARLDAEEKHLIKEMIEGVILRHQAKQLFKIPSKG